MTFEKKTYPYINITHITLYLNDLATNLVLSENKEHTHFMIDEDTENQTLTFSTYDSDDLYRAKIAWGKATTSGMGRKLLKRGMSSGLYLYMPSKKAFQHINYIKI